MAKPRKPVPPPRSRPVDLYLYLLLAAATLAVYSQAIHFDFLNYDDPAYVVNNPQVRAGLTWDGLAWAFTSFHAANWFPLTWLSHMTDCQFFAMRGGWHHLTSIVIHTAAALLLFAALHRLTGARWPSAFVAFLFALHPLHVESVAWIAERKDVLCALFWFLALYWYADYARRPSIARYLPVVLAFCLGLMAKSMIVTLPFVLLLLDYWPLRRPMRRALLWEKLPLVVLSAGAVLLTFLAQEHGNAVRSLSNIPLGFRLENAVAAYAVYLVRAVWPADLAVFYPYRFDLPAWQVAASAALLATITALVIRKARTHPYLAVGWLWYVGTLLPVIGLVQVGAQSSADRYMYVPMVGLGIMLAWGASHAPRFAAIGVLAVCAVLTWRQLSYWRDTETLFQHAADVTTGNYLAHNNLGEYYLTHNRNQQAALHIQAALRIRPAYPDAHANLALVLRRAGRLADSEREYRQALALQPVSGPFHAAYAGLLIGEGRTNEAVSEFYEAIRLQPGNAATRHSLGFILLSRGRLDEALVQFRAEAQLEPGNATVHFNLGTLLASAGHFEEAAAEFTQALRIQPDFSEARARLEQARTHQK
ncbi:MAG: tetratricopeptide repeat protein [Candidatus Sulfopaludibacter sp.]|nr:tetratricopeptide repeat protein [Candidatus Sulfopaludibacter sp.]